MKKKRRKRGGLAIDNTRNDENNGGSKLGFAGSLKFVTVKMFCPVGSTGKQSKMASLL